MRVLKGFMKLCVRFLYVMARIRKRWFLVECEIGRRGYRRRKIVFPLNHKRHATVGEQSETSFCDQHIHLRRVILQQFFYPLSKKQCLLVSWSKRRQLSRQRLKNLLSCYLHRMSSKSKMTTHGCSGSNILAVNPAMKTFKT
jgi:hypothetical protein